MKARVKWTEGVAFVVESGSGHAVVVDGAPEAGGRYLGMRPMELMLAGAAACTAFDVVWILKRARQPIADCVVEAAVQGRPGRALRHGEPFEKWPHSGLRIPLNAGIVSVFAGIREHGRRRGARLAAWTGPSGRSRRGRIE